MRVRYIEISNVKSIPKKESENSNRLIFCKENNIENDPTSTIILGSNGTSKSTFLESLALLSHANILPVCDKNPKSKSDNYIEIGVQITFVNKNKTEPTEANFTVVFSAVKNMDKGIDNEHTKLNETAINVDRTEFSKETAGLLSSHIVDENLLKQHWCVFYDLDKNKKKFKEITQRNRPKYPIDDDFNLHKSNRQTVRSQILDQLDIEEDQDKRNKIKDKLKNEFGTINLVNTDMNDFGMGLNIFESPKNIKTDLPRVIHYRLPCTINNRNLKNNGQLRNLKDLQKQWKKIFPGREIKEVACIEKIENKKVVRCEAKFDIKNNFGVDINGIETLSSGENEVFFVLATILSLELYNSVLLLDEPELHMSMEQLQSYYEVLFELANEYELQLIFVTHQPFVANHVVEKSDEKFQDIEMRLLKPNNKKKATKLLITHDRKNIEKEIFIHQIAKFYAKAFNNWEDEKIKQQSLSSNIEDIDKILDAIKNKHLSEKDKKSLREIGDKIYKIRNNSH